MKLWCIVKRTSRMPLFSSFARDIAGYKTKRDAKNAAIRWMAACGYEVDVECCELEVVPLHANIPAKKPRKVRK